MRSRPNSDGLQDRSVAASSIDSRNLPSESSQCQVAGVQSSRALDAPLPGVTVVVCTRNRPDDLTSSLDAISRLNPGPNEILVVDNSDGDPAVERAARERGARYVVEREIGLSRARNRGLAESRSQIVAFIDDDAVPSENWLELLLSPFADPQVASASGDVAFHGVPRNAEAAPVRIVGNKDQKWFEMATFGGMGWGANMAIRKSVCSVWKGFDVRLGKGAPLDIAEESHAFASLLALGYRTAYVPAAVVYHPVKPWEVREQAVNSFAFWLLLFCEFPGHRFDLIRFLSRRLRGKALTWPRESQEAGQIVSSRWPLLIKAGVAGTLLYLRSRKLRAR